MFKMWSLGSTTSDPHSTPTADTLHLHLGIHVQLQSADWFKKNIDLVITFGAKRKNRMQYFINQWHLGTKKTTSGLFPATRDLLSHSQPLSYSEEERAPESWRQRGLSLLEYSAEGCSSYLTTGPRVWRSLPTISICPALWTLSSFIAKTSTVFMICHLLIN